MAVPVLVLVVLASVAASIAVVPAPACPLFTRANVTIFVACWASASLNTTLAAVNVPVTGAMNSTSVVPAEVGTVGMVSPSAFPRRPVLATRFGIVTFDHCEPGSVSMSAIRISLLVLRDPRIPDRLGIGRISLDAAANLRSGSLFNLSENHFLAIREQVFCSVWQPFPIGVNFSAAQLLVCHGAHF